MLGDAKKSVWKDWLGYPPLSPKEVLQDTAEKPSEGQKNSEQQCSDKKEVADRRNKEIESLHRRTEELNNLVNQRVEELEFESEKAKLLNRIQELESQLKKLNEVGLSKDPSINNPSKEEREEERKEEPPYTKVDPPVKKSTISMGQQIVYLSPELHDALFGKNRDINNNNIKELIKDLIKEVNSHKKENPGKTIVFPIYLSPQLLDVLFKLTEEKADLQKELLECIMHFAPPKWNYLYAVMKNYDICCRFIMSKNIKIVKNSGEEVDMGVRENLGWTNLFPKFRQRFVNYYKNEWVSFLDPNTGKVIPLDKVLPLFGTNVN